MLKSLLAANCITTHTPHSQTIQKNPKSLYFQLSYLLQISVCYLLFFLDFVCIPIKSSLNFNRYFLYLFYGCVIRTICVWGNFLIFIIIQNMKFKVCNTDNNADGLWETNVSTNSFYGNRVLLSCEKDHSTVS